MRYECNLCNKIFSHKGDYEKHINKKKTCKKASSTLRTSRAVTHPSTIRAFRRLTSEFGWDPVFSTQYGR